MHLYRVIIFVICSLVPVLRLQAQDQNPVATSQSSKAQNISTSVQVFKDRNGSAITRKWQLLEDEGTVQKALKVYKDKKDDRPIKKLWIVNKADGSRSYLVEFRRGDHQKTLFSPDEDFFYYIGLNDQNEETVFGINLTTQQKFAINSASDFDVLRCHDDKSYVVIKDLNEQTRLIYQSNGTPVDMIKGGLTKEKIWEDICGQIQKGVR